MAQSALEGHGNGRARMCPSVCCVPPARCLRNPLLWVRRGFVLCCASAHHSVTGARQFVIRSLAWRHLSSAVAAVINKAAVNTLIASFCGHTFSLYVSLGKLARSGAAGRRRACTGSAFPGLPGLSEGAVPLGLHQQSGRVTAARILTSTGHHKHC